MLIAGWPPDGMRLGTAPAPLRFVRAALLSAGDQRGRNPRSAGRFTRAVGTGDSGDCGARPRSQRGARPA